MIDIAQRAQQLADAPPHAAGTAVYRWGTSGGRAAIHYLLLRDTRRPKEWGFPKAVLSSGESTTTAARRALRSALGVSFELEDAAGVHALTYVLPHPTARFPDGQKRCIFHVACAPEGLRTSTDGDAVWLPLAAAEIRAEHAEMRALLRALERAIVSASHSAQAPEGASAAPVARPPAAAPAAALATERGTVEGESGVCLLGFDLLVAVLNHTDALTLGHCWTVSRAWHAAVRSITARALHTLDALSAGAPLRADGSGNRRPRPARSAAGAAELVLGSDDIWWLSQLHPPLLRAQLLRNSAALPSLAHACYEHAVRASAASDGAPPPLPRLVSTEASRMALAAVAFAACDRAAPAGSASAAANGCGSFGETLLARVRAETRVAGTSFLAAWAQRHAAAGEGGGAWKWGGGQQGGSGSAAFGFEAISYEPAESSSGALGVNAAGDGSNAAQGAEHAVPPRVGSELAACRFFAQLFAHGFAPWADRRRTLRLFHRLSCRLLCDVDSFVAATSPAAADAGDGCAGSGRSVPGVDVETLGLARRVASDSVVVLCELVACCAMRLQLEWREATDGFTRHALELLRDAAVAGLAEALPEVSERWVRAGGGALTPGASGALSALRAFEAVGWELEYGSPGMPALGVPDLRIARL